MSNPTLIVHNGKSKMFANLRPGFYDGDWQLREFPEAKDICDVQSYRLDGVTLCDDEPMLWYTGELAGSQGMGYIIFKEEKHTAEDVRKAKGYIRRSFDVAGAVRVINI